ncbi:MAG TPA: response regulator [Planctomycetota bacterium]|jgi:two-component system chemotaxis response regulator CheY|nr:response regulator [Planctomycetota bacterium]
MEALQTVEAPRKVLIADDDAVTRTLLSQCFKSEGFGVTTAADGVEACTVAGTEKHDVILVDLLLPRRDGYSVLLYLRSREGSRETPVLILSGESSEEHPGIARLLGAQGYIPKPFDPKVVLSTAKELLSKNGRR